MHLDMGAIVSLAEQPWLDREQMVGALQQMLAGFRINTMRFDEDLAAEDPWLWSITGQFGAVRDDIATPGGILACSRYGVDTRDRLAGSLLSDPSTFRLLRITMAAHDDAAVWPEGAVARLACMMTWDDTRRVHILPLAAVLGPMEPRFAEISVTGDEEHYGEHWQRYSPLYGADGYRVEARGGVRRSAFVVERMLVEFRVTHQRITFRTFLMGGGA